MIAEHNLKPNVSIVIKNITLFQLFRKFLEYT